MREEHAEWAHQVRRDIDQRKTHEHQEQLDLGITERRHHALDGPRSSQERRTRTRGSWGAA